MIAISWLSDGGVACIIYRYNTELYSYISHLEDDQYFCSCLGGVELLHIGISCLILKSLAQAPIIYTGIVIIIKQNLLIT